MIRIFDEGGIEVYLTFEEYHRRKNYLINKLNHDLKEANDKISEIYARLSRS